MRVRCPDCSQAFKVADDRERTAVRCPACKVRIDLDALGSPPDGNSTTSSGRRPGGVSRTAPPAPRASPSRAGGAPRRQKLPVGIIPLAILAPLMVIFGVLTPFFEWATMAALALTLPLFFFSLIRVFLIFRKKGLGDEISEAGRGLTGGGAKVLVLQISYAFNRPRVFACWVILEMLSIIVLIESAIMAGVWERREKSPANNQSSNTRKDQPSSDKTQADSVTQALAKLDDPTGNRRYDGAWGLGNMKSDPKRQAEVARKLAALLNSPDRRLVSDVTRALAVWATPAEVPQLIEAAVNPDFPARAQVIEILGKLGDERAVEPLVRLLKDNQARPLADGALKQLGPMAEKEVLKLLNNEAEDATVRNEAADVLKVIGTRESVPSLEKVVKTADGILRGTAEEALVAIAGRSQK